MIRMNAAISGQPIEIAPKTVVKARIVKQLKDAILPKQPK